LPVYNRVAITFFGWHSKTTTELLLRDNSWESTFPGDVECGWDPGLLQQSIRIFRLTWLDSTLIEKPDRHMPVNMPRPLSPCWYAPGKGPPDVFLRKFKHKLPDHASSPWHLTETSPRQVILDYGVLILLKYLDIYVIYIG
jgi:hypothetical protein